jgi:N-acetylglutamate synthase-like GNAT family acetyltransferase
MFLPTDRGALQRVRTSLAANRKARGASVTTKETTLAEDIWVRSMEQRDIPKFVKYLTTTARNLVDEAVYKYPLLKTLVAHSQRKIVAFMSSQTVLMLEALAINQDSRKLEVASALAQLTKMTVLRAREAGIRELYMVIGDDSTAQFAKLHKFEEIPGRLFRLKIDSLEDVKPEENKDSNDTQAA